MIGNGSILATGDARDQICELYRSPLGPDRQILRRPSRLGIAVGREFRWLPDRFEVTTGMAERGPFGEARLVSSERGLEIRTELFVDIFLDVLIRRIHVRNLTPRDRELTLYAQHDLRLTAPEPHDAAFLDPETGGIVHHGGRCFVLINMATPLGPGVPLARLGARDEVEAPGAAARAPEAFATRSGPVEGLVDSVAGAFVALRPDAGVTVDIWLAVGDSYAEVRDLDRAVRHEGISRLLARSRAHWALWSAVGETDASDLPEDVVRLKRRSLWILRLHQDRGGALLSSVEPARPGGATPDRRYAWFRDGAMAADALGAAGHGARTRRYFEFCARALSEAGRAAAVFSADGSIGAAPRRVFAAPGGGDPESGGPPAPLDGFGLHLWALGRQFERDRDVEFVAPRFRDTVVPLADTLAASLDPATRLPGPALDPWEARSGLHAGVAAAVIGGLRSAARLAVGFGEGDRARRWAVAAEEAARALGAQLCPPGLGRFGRSLNRRGEEMRIDATLDASLLWLPLFGDFEPEDPRVRATVEAVRERLWLREGPGGLLPHEPAAGTAGAAGEARASVLATLWLALHAARTARTLRELDTARTILLWCAARSGETGHLSEWLPAGGGDESPQSPYMPAHACFVRAVMEYEERSRVIQRCDRCGAPARARRSAGGLANAPLPGLIAHE